METPAPERPDAPPPAAPRGARRLALLVLGVFGLALALRAAAPALARWAIEREVSRAIAGELEIGDLDLSLSGRTLRLRDVALRDPAAPAGDPPVLALRDAVARFSLEALGRREIRVRELVLGTPVLDLDRLEDGRLDLAVLLGGGDAAAPDAEPAAGEPARATWRVALDHVRLEGGRIEFRDFAVAGSETLEVEVERLEIDRLATRPGAYGEPAHLRFAARAGEARLALDAQIQPEAEGFVVQATVRGEALPLRQALVYLPAGAFGRLEGRLDAQLAFDFATAERSRVFGDASLRDLVLQAPGGGEPALRFARLDVALHEIDLVAQRAAVGRATLEAPLLAVVPEATQPLPLLALLPPDDDADARPWAWSVDRIEVRNGGLAFAAGPGRTATTLGIQAVVEGLSGAAQARARVDAELTSPPARARWQGTLALEPLEPLGSLEVGELSVERLLALLPAARRPALPAELLRGQVGASLRLEPARSVQGTLTLRDGVSRLEWEGRASASPFAATGSLRFVDLELRRVLALVPPGALPVAFEVERGRVGGQLDVEAGAPAEDGLRASGTVRVADVLVTAPGEGGPSAGWRFARLDLASLRAPGILAETGPRPAEPIVLELSRVRVRGPSVRLVRDAGGFVWPPPPPVLREAAAAAPAEPPATPELAAAPGAEDAAPSRLRLRVAALELTGGEVRLVDRSVTPWYQGHYTDVSLRARDLGWPWTGTQGLEASARLPSGATIRAEGKGDAQGLTVVARGERIPLPPLNPYFTAQGYSVRQGTLSLVSSLWIGGAGFEAKNWLVLHGLDLGGPSGDSLFRQEFGVPLSVALPLLRDLSGDISLPVPIWLGRDGFGVGVGAAIRSAIGQALTWALASPLKLLRAALPSFEKTSAPVLEAIPFAPGSSEVRLEAGAAKPIAALAELVAASPGLEPTLEGVVGERDERAIREAVLLERLQGGVLERVRSLTGVGPDARLRRYLTGETTSLSPEDEAELEARLGEIAVGEEELRALARAREAATRDWLAAQHGIARVALASEQPGAPISRGEPAVRVRIGSR